MKTLKITTSALGLFLALTLLGNAADVRTWTDKSGEFNIEAEFVGFADDKVKLELDDGEVIEVDIDDLSDRDRRWVQTELRRLRRTSRTATDDPTASGETEESSRVDNSEPKSAGDDAFQFRGENFQGVFNETGLIKQWPEDGPPLDWSTRELGRGYSSVSIGDGFLYTMGKFRAQTKLLALDINGGGRSWDIDVGEGGNDPNCTPFVDIEADLVFGLSNKGDLLCANAQSGEPVWRKSYTDDFGGRMMSGWGYSETPLVDGDLLICTPGGDRAVMIALNKRTGETVWQTRETGSGGAGYSSPVISNGGGVKQYITLVGKGLIGVSAETGELLWHYERIANTTANIPTALVIDDFVFCSTGYGDGGSALLKLSGRGGQVGFEEVYYKSNRELQNHHGGMVRLGDYVYFGHGHNNGLPVCIEWRTGRLLWGPLRGPGTDSAAVVAADGKLYFRYENGVMALIDASPDGYQLQGSFSIASNNGRSWPHPLIANGKLYLRDQDELHCYDISQ